MGVRGSCHCRATQFEVADDPTSATRCTCTFCSKRGALWSYHTPDKFRLLTARDRVSTYQWGSYTIQHHHCAICGCGTWTETPSWIDGKPDFSRMRVSVNVRLLDDFDIDALPVETIDGRNLW